MLGWPTAKRPFANAGSWPPSDYHERRQTASTMLMTASGFAASTRDRAFSTHQRHPLPGSRRHKAAVGPMQSHPKVAPQQWAHTGRQDSGRFEAQHAA